GLSRKAAGQGMQILKLLKTSRDEAEGGMYYDQLCELIGTEKPEMAAFYRKCREQHLNFLKYPTSCRKHIYTTNAVESVNSGIERMRINLGGYFPSQRAMDVNLFIQFVNLQDAWEKKVATGLRECLYEIRQMFALRFEIQDNG
ncbi:MAG: transposase, partial [Elusimicrobiales bacterium]|nr:transposase [Elusimicrobiales bacterium]